MMEPSCVQEAPDDVTGMLHTYLQFLQINVRKIPYIFMGNNLPRTQKHQYFIIFYF
jgi:hypothetical protein